MLISIVPNCLKSHFWLVSCQMGYFFEVLLTHFWAMPCFEDLSRVFLLIAGLVFFSLEFLYRYNKGCIICQAHFYV